MSPAQMADLRTAAFLAIHILFWGGALFAIVYTVAAPWWRYRAGRAYISFDFMLLLALLGDILYLDFDIQVRDSLFWNWFATGALLLGGPIMVYRIYAVIRENIEGRRKQREELEREDEAKDEDKPVR